MCLAVKTSNATVLKIIHSDIKHDKKANMQTKPT